MTGFIQDIRYALRALARAPGFAMVSIVTLALGFGATTIVYSLVDGVLLRPLPIRRATRVDPVTRFARNEPQITLMKSPEPQMTPITQI